LNRAPHTAGNGCCRQSVLPLPHPVFGEDDTDITITDGRLGYFETYERTADGNLRTPLRIDTNRLDVLGQITAVNGNSTP
jgi:hypothetical protein